MTRFLNVFFLLGTLVFLSGCSSIDMPDGTSEGYTSARFFKTGGEVKPAFVDSDMDINAVIQPAIREEFEKHGIEVRDTDSEPADLIIAYLLLSQSPSSTAAISTYFGYGRAAEITDKAHQKGVLDRDNLGLYRRGAIVIDLLDTRTNELVFRHIAVRDGTRNPTVAQREETIRSAVREALSEFFAE